MKTDVKISYGTTEFRYFYCVDCDVGYFVEEKQAHLSKFCPICDKKG